MHVPVEQLLYTTSPCCLRVLCGCVAFKNNTRMKHICIQTHVQGVCKASMLCAVSTNIYTQNMSKQYAKHFLFANKYVEHTFTVTNLAYLYHGQSSHLQLAATTTTTTTTTTTRTSYEPCNVSRHFVSFPHFFNAFKVVVACWLGPLSCVIGILGIEKDLISDL